MNNSSARIAAKRYGAAYDSLSATTQEAISHSEELSSASHALADVQALLVSPSVPLIEKEKAVQAALANLPQVASFLTVLLRAKRYAILPQIVEEVNALADKRQGILRAQVTSARELDAVQKAATEKTLSARYGKTVKAVFQTDENLLGGLKIYCKGELLDGSVAGELDRLQKELIK